MPRSPSTLASPSKRVRRVVAGMGAQRLRIELLTGLAPRSRYSERALRYDSKLRLLLKARFLKNDRRASEQSAALCSSDDTHNQLEMQCFRDTTVSGLVEPIS